MKKTISLFATVAILASSIPVVKATDLALNIAVNDNSRNGSTANVYWNTNIEASCGIDFATTSDVSNGIGTNGHIIQVGTSTNDGRFYYVVNLNNLVTSVDYYYQVNCTLPGSNYLYQSDIKRLAASNIIPTVEKPDLIIKNLKFSENQVNDQGITNQLEFDVVNIGGSRPAGNFRVVVKNNTRGVTLYEGNLSGDYFVPTVHSSHIYVMNVLNKTQLVSGDRVKIMVDVDNAIAESNETNNILEVDASVSNNQINTDPLSDLTITGINFTASHKMETGKMMVTVKNLGAPLYSTRGLLNWYNNLSSQNFVFISPTNSVMNFKTDRILPDALNPLKNGEAITFYWYGAFNTSGNLYLHFTVDNANELPEVNDGNNTLSTSVNISEAEEPVASSSIAKPDLVINDLQVANEGGQYYLRFVFANKGAKTKDGQVVSLKAVDAETGQEYTSGYSKAFEGQVTALASRSLAEKENREYKLKAVIDYAQIVDESNETNNYFVRELSFDQLSVHPAVEPKPQEIKPLRPEVGEYETQAKNLKDGKIQELLSQIKQLRDELREQSAELKYLKVFAAQMRALNSNMQTAIKSFIAYGVDDNTKKLGEGERAAVVNSYEAAFDKLPQTEAELADAIKIANGRFPSIVSDKAEQGAKEQFYKIYKRVADMNDSKDAAAIKVMAYGLRQKATNRNMKSEATGIKTFKNIFGKTPQKTEDWNAMQAITYSGASRKADTDKDGVADETEKKLGTNPEKADTDGDGYKDGEEVLKGFNPKGK